MSDLSSAIPAVALFEPRIPPNTGNIARTCAAFQLPLELIGLGFRIDDRSLKRTVSTTGSMSASAVIRTDALRALPARRRLIGCSRWGVSISKQWSLNRGMLLFGREDTVFLRQFAITVIRSSRSQCPEMPMRRAVES